MTFSRRWAVLAIPLALPLSIASLLSSATAHARDFCFNSSLYSPAILVVAKDFRLPRKGTCRPIVGWDAGFFGFAVTRPASGAAGDCGYTITIP